MEPSREDRQACPRFRNRAALMAAPALAHASSTLHDSPCATSELLERDEQGIAINIIHPPARAGDIVLAALRLT